MINESRFIIYKADMDYEDRNGRIRTGTRWAIRDGDGNRLPRTFKTGKAAAAHVRDNFGWRANVQFQSSR